MNVVVIPALSLLLLLLLTSASLPWLGESEYRLAKRTGRSLFLKSALQITQLTILVQAGLFLAMAADFFMDGRITRYCAGPLRMPWLLVVLAIGVAFVISFVALICAKGGKPGKISGRWLLVVSGLCAAAAAAAGVALSWVFLRGAYLVPSVMEHPDIVELARTFLYSEKRLPLFLYALISFVLAMVAGRGLILMWYVVRRNRADYGRDYYNTVVSNQGVRVFKLSGLVLLPLMVLFLILLPDFSLSRLPWLMPLPAERVTLMLSILTLCLPLAVICWNLLARAEHPLRRKSLIFLAPVLTAVWYYAQLAKLWL